jgi:ABC-type multidrug transport system ATPase subunit
MTADSSSHSQTHAVIELPEETRFGHLAGCFPRRRFVEVLKVPKTLRIHTGLHVLIAANGSGKTTLMRTLAGLQPAVAGNIVVRGPVLYFADDLGFAPELNARQVFSSLLPGNQASLALSLAERLRLDLGKPYRALSRGNRQKISLILAETHAGHGLGGLILQDESLAGLDPPTRREIFGLWEQKRQSRCRIIALHETEALQCVDSVLSIQAGELRQHEPRSPGELRQLCESLTQ